MSRPALVVHGHFYQPPRLDPFTGTMPVDATAAPSRDWNERISAECYRPNAELGNLGAMSWFADSWLAPAGSATDRATFAVVMEAQRWRLSMFASCGWFWDEPARVETAAALRAAVRAARLIDGLAGTDLERRLVADLHLVAAEGLRLVYSALVAVGAPLANSGGSPSGPENRSARGLRATG